MVTSQSKQSVPIQKTNRLLIRNGSETAITHVLGSDFVFVAKQDGEVVEYDPKTELMIIQYKDGTKDTINLAPDTVKNGGKFIAALKEF